MTTEKRDFYGLEPAERECPVRKFRKKPVVVEAAQYVDESLPEPMLSFLECVWGWQQGKEGILLPTLEGEMLARRGDWIIKGVAGEFYPCKPDIFAATYEAVD